MVQVAQIWAGVLRLAQAAQVSTATIPTNTGTHNIPEHFCLIPERDVLVPE